MRIKNGFVLRQMCGEYVVTAESLEMVNFNKLITLNDSAAYVWQMVENRDFTVEDIKNMLVERYGIDSEAARVDAANLCESWEKAGVTE